MSALRAAIAFAGILLALSLAGCQHEQPKIVLPKVVERKPAEIPKSLLECMPEPVARDVWESQKDVTLFMESLALAGQDCRVRLGKVRKLLRQQSVAVPVPAG